MICSWWHSSEDARGSIRCRCRKTEPIDDDESWSMDCSPLIQLTMTASWPWYHTHPASPLILYSLLSSERQAAPNPSREQFHLSTRVSWSDPIRSVASPTYSIPTLRELDLVAWFSTTLHYTLHSTKDHITTQTIAPNLPNQHHTVAFAACRAWKKSI